MKLTMSSEKDPRLPSSVSPADREKLAQTVEALLLEWNYPDVGRAVFSEAEQDLVIGNQLRTSHGKGVRALTCAAFIIGLMRHCLEHDHAYPSLVVLDSPLVANEKADFDEKASGSGKPA